MAENGGGGSRIRVLDPTTADQIAAGEVVERPASVVKELVENALDALARRIRVELREGGTQGIAVSDDGVGMTPAEARLAVQRHATSKIRTLANLGRLATLGFRGEALPSIAAVSRLDLQTRPADALAGFRLVLEGGREVTALEAACAAGTRVSVNRLFFNTPARRKHMSGATAELSQGLETLTALALAHPDTSLTVVHGDRTLFQTPGSGRLLDAILACLGRPVAGEMLPVGGEREGLRLSGFVARPAAGRANRSYQYFFVNGRPVQAPLLREALEEAYRGLLMLHRYPVAVLALAVDPGRIDVNIHPSKRTVRFETEPAVAELVHRSVYEALAAADLAPRIAVTRRSDRERWRQEDLGLPEGRPGLAAKGEQPAWRGAPALPEAVEAAPERLPEMPPSATEPFTAGGEGVGLPVREAPAGYARGAEPENALRPGGAAWCRGRRPSADALNRPAQRWPSLRVLGQIARTYILAEGADGFYVIDQHAAHERLYFEAFHAQRESGEHISKPLAIPIPLHCTAGEFAFWSANRPRLEAIGFRCEPFGGETLLLREVPALFAEGGHQELFRDLLDQMRGLAGTGREPVLEVDLAGMAMASCKAAVKAHDVLSRPEMEALVDDLARARNPFTCPHGRPTTLHLTEYQLARHFKRIV